MNPDITILAGRGAEGAHDVRLALALCAVLAAIDIVGPLLPKSEGEIAFGIVAAALVAIAAVAIARARRWGYIMGIVLAALHALSDGAAIFIAEEPLLTVIAAVATGVAATLLVVLVRARPRAAPATPAAD